MNENFNDIVKNFKSTEDLPHITAKEFCKNLEGIIEKVSKEKIPYVITYKKKLDIVICPIEWFDMRYDEDFQLVLLSAVRYSFRRNTYMPSVVIDFIRRNIYCVTDNTITLLIRDINEGLNDDESLFGEVPQRGLWEKFLMELIEYQNKKDDKK